MSYQTHREVPHRPFMIAIDVPIGSRKGTQSAILGHQDWMNKTGNRNPIIRVRTDGNSFALPKYDTKIVPFPGSTIIVEGDIEDADFPDDKIWELLCSLASSIACEVGKSPLEEHKDDPNYARVSFAGKTRIIQTLLPPITEWSYEIPLLAGERPAQRPRRRRAR